MRKCVEEGANLDAGCECGCGWSFAVVEYAVGNVATGDFLLHMGANANGIPPSRQDRMTCGNCVRYHVVWKTAANLTDDVTALFLSHVRTGVIEIPTPV